jgi:hypothetical protein
LVVLEGDAALVLGPAQSARSAIGAVADALHPVIGALATAGASQQSEPAQQRTAVPQTPQNAGIVSQPPDEAGVEQPIPQLRRRTRTSYGGLLFLLHIVADLELANDIAQHPVLSARGFRWSMHQLALTLCPGAEPGDPAALAFAGLPPDDVPPSRGEAPPTDAEIDALAAFARHITVALEQRLPPEREQFASLLLRSAEVVADPGWIDVCFSLPDVSTAVRRAGLDLDLGYLPWLGVVMRFVYE